MLRCNMSAFAIASEWHRMADQMNQLRVRPKALRRRIGATVIADVPGINQFI
jgi:hypothetical protein